jgi:regulator of protease activity HflC (stomatin/prohibitin superfamily)
MGKFLGAGAFGVLFVILLMICISGTTNIPPGYNGLVFNRFGAGLQDQPLGQGYTWQAPWKTVTLYPISTETVYYTKAAHEGRKTDDSMWVSTKDGKSVNVDLTIAYHFDPSKLAHIFTKFKGASTEAIEYGFVKNEIYFVVNNITSQYAAMDLIGDKRPAINAKIKDELSKLFMPDGMVLETASISRIEPDGETSKAIQLVINAQNDLRTAELQRQQAEIEAAKLRISAQGKADASVIEATGKAKANDLLKISLSPQLVQWEWVKKWDGILPKTNLGSSTGVMVNLN